MKNIIKTISPFLLLLMLTLPYSSCVKKEFDEPPLGGQDPAFSANTTIAALKAMYNGTIIKITDDIIIAGIVIGDDESGNFYKSIVIQDATAGINIQIDQSEYWRSYKVGRRVFVKCKGLYLGAYGEQIQLGGYIDNSSSTPSVGRIPLSLIPQYLYGGVWGLSVTPKHVSNRDSLDLYADQNTLVTFHGVQFVSGSSCTPWADIAGQTSGNRTLTDAFGNWITVRTSNFATFAASLTPNDTGSITGVFQRFTSTYQLVIRSLNDVQMASTCCSSPTLVSIDSVRKMFVNAPGTVAGCFKIRGIVISDKDNANITFKNIMLQDNSADPRGIIIRFTANNTFALGDEIEVNITGDSISKFNGSLQVKDVDLGGAVKISSGNVITPRIVTIADINANFYNWESTLVKVQNVTINGGTVSTYAGNKPLSDATGSGLILYTSNGASFSGVNHPATATSIIGYLTPYNGTYEISIRNLSDVIP